MSNPPSVLGAAIIEMGETAELLNYVTRAARATSIKDFRALMEAVGDMAAWATNRSAKVLIACKGMAGELKGHAPEDFLKAIAELENADSDLHAYTAEE